MAAALERSVRAMFDRHWMVDGYTAPNPAVYPWQWLWDSCFHAIVWCRLGEPERAIIELRSALAHQDADGFVPHITYAPGPSVHRSLWGRTATSSITQPPMFGHAVAELHRAGVAVDDELVDRCLRGLAFLLTRRRRRPSGLVELCHPWESGTDDSPRWDAWCPGGFDRSRWYTAKGALVGSVVRSASGAPVANDGFEVAGAGWNALLAFNARELSSVVSDGDLDRHARALADALDARWSEERQTWDDDGSRPASSGVRTLDALLPALVSDRPGALGQLLDREAFGAAHGPRGVHLAEVTHAPQAYWRGPSWPHLSYLLWTAARRRDEHRLAMAIASALVRGAHRSGLSEYWDAESGGPLGARPQAWAGLALLVMDRPGPPDR